jgi:hypothetical protein
MPDTSGEHPEGTAPPSKLAVLAALLGEPGSPPPAIVDPGPSWGGTPPRLPDGSDSALWGRPAAASSRDWATLATAAARREQRILTCRVRHSGALGPLLVHLRRTSASAGGTLVVHRLHPRALSTGWRARARQALLSGVIVELRSPAFHAPLLSEILESAGHRGPTPTLAVSSGGGVHARISTGLLRCGATGTAGDPTRSVEGLNRLRGHPLLPRVIGEGQVAALRWSVETFLPGSRPSRLSPLWAADVAASLACLPQVSRPDGLDEDVALVRESVGADQQLAGDAPSRRSLDDWLLRRLGPLEGLPGIFAHGDLWHGNLLVRDHALSGIIDWDAWRPAGVPGADLLHLLATQQQLSTKTSLGEVFLQQPWTFPVYRATAEKYFQQLSIRADPVTLRAIGTAWWVSQLAADIRRDATLVSNQEWMSRNLLCVVRRAVHGSHDR